MIKKLNKIDKIVFYAFLFFTFFALLMAFIFDVKNKLVDIKYAFDYVFVGLFKSSVMQTIIVLLLLIMIILFIVIWTIGTRKIKKFSFGAIYFVSFFILFLLSNGYYNAFNKFTFGFLCLLLASIYCFISTIYSFLSYYLTIKNLENIDE